MAEDENISEPTVRRPPGVPAPPSKDEIDQISKDQALIDDEWGDTKPPAQNDQG